MFFLQQGLALCVFASAFVARTIQPGAFKEMVSYKRPLVGQGLLYGNADLSGSPSVLSSPQQKHLKVREETQTMELRIEAVLEQLDTLNLRWAENKDYFAKLLRLAADREMHLPIGVFHRTMSDVRGSIGLLPKKRDLHLPANRRAAGENFGLIEDYGDGYIILSLISGNSDSLPKHKDSSELCGRVNKKVISSHFSVENKAWFTSGTFADFVWQSAQAEVSGSGCFSMLQASVSAERRIHIINLGMSWAGLFRDGALIKQTKPQLHSDGSQFEICSPVEPGQKDHMGNGLRYTWEAKSDDIFVVVSRGVRELLLPEQILDSFTLIKRLGPEAEEFMKNDDVDLYGMGIVKAARIASDNKPQLDMLAMVVQLD